MALRTGSSTLRSALLASLWGIGLALGPIAGARAAEPAEWTIMVFMNADNNLEKFGVDDFLEMAKVGSTDKVNVIVQFDRTPGYDNRYGDWTQTLRFRVTKDMEPTVANAVEDIGEVDMGDANVLADFVRWAMTKYPAKHYALDIWDHGQGWRFGRAVSAPPEHRERIIERKKAAFKLLNKEPKVGPGEIPLDRVTPGTHRYISIDESSGSKLYNRAIQESLKTLLQGKKLDLIGFDACLMSMTETAYAMREVAAVMAGSEELEPGKGWDYERVLNKLIANPTADAPAFGKILVDCYKDQYSGHDEETTFAAIDLSKLDDLAASIGALAEECKAKLDAELAAIKGARGECTEYAPGYGLNGIDLGRFCERLVSQTADPALKTKAQAVRDGVTALVIANFAGTDRQGTFGSSGMAIYFPRSRADYQSDPDREGYDPANTNYPVEFVQKNPWAPFLHAYFAKVP